MNIERVKQQALDYLLKHGSHPTAVHLFGTRGNTVVLLVGIPEKGIDKQKAVFLAGAKAAASQTIGVLQALFLVTESWVSIGKSSLEITAPPSADPQRKEAPVVIGIDILTKEQRMFMFELVRDRGGTVRSIQPLLGREEMQAVSNPYLLTFLAGYASRGVLAPERK